LIQDLGGSRSLMGITITVGGIAGIPLLALSGPIISKIGHANVLFIGFVFYAVRLVGKLFGELFGDDLKDAENLFYKICIIFCNDETATVRFRIRHTVLIHTYIILIEM